jgi:V8-like Glu-specific endopeptidase
MSSRRTPAPIASAQLARRAPMPATAPPSAQVTLNHGRIHVPAGGKARLVPVDDIPDTYRVEVMLPGNRVGQRYHETIPVEILRDSHIQSLGNRSHGPGHRPPHFAVEYVPALGDQAQPRPRSNATHGLPTGVFSPDERELLASTHFPWCTVGRIDTPYGTGTACTIGPRLLLTANHLIAWNRDGTAGWARFRPAYDLGTAPFGEAWATCVIAWFPTTPADGMTGREVAFDYAICVLDTPIGEIVGYPGYRTYDDEWNGDRYWQHLGYPSDLAASQRPAYQGELHVATAEDHRFGGQIGRVLGHFSDIVPGHSGGPLWGWWADDPWPTIVGVQSSQSPHPAYTQAGDNECAGGPALSLLIAHARERYG